MADSLEKISDDELAPKDVRGRRATLKKLASFCNAGLNTKLLFNTGCNKRTITEGNDTFEFDIKQAIADSNLTAPPTPFALLPVTTGGASFRLNPNSYLRRNPTLSANTAMTGSTAAITVSAGLCVWLQLDFDDSGNFREASIAHGQTPPYQTNGGKLITFAGNGSPGDPFVQDQAFTPLAQVLDADASGQPVRGGIVYTISATAKVEIVQQTCTHLSCKTIVGSAQIGLFAQCDSGPLLS